MSANQQAMQWLLAGLIGFAGLAQADGKTKMYRWVDAAGQVHYGDKMPPNEAKRGRETLNERGTVIGVVPKELAGAELEQRNRQLAADKAAEEAHEKRKAYDRALVLSYTDVADIEAAREERLQAIDGRLGLVQKSVIDNEKTLSDLRSRAGNKAPTGDLKNQIESFQSSLADNRKAERKLQDDRLATDQKYTADIERFMQLKAGTIRQGD